MSPMIETVSGDMQEKYNTYKTMMKRYNLAVKHEFYFEAMLIIYAMLEDRFRSFIYHAGFLDDRDSKGLGHKRLKLFVRFLMEEYCDIPHDSRLKLDNISAKMDVVKSLIMWAQNDREPVGKFQTELKKQLKKVECDELLVKLTELTEWLRCRNEIIHGLMNKKADKLADSLPEMVEKGLAFARFFDKQVGRIDKNDSVRNLRMMRK